MSKEKLLKRLAKLKALASCPTGNPNETATAAATMQRLMLENSIDEHEIAGAASKLEAEKQSLNDDWMIFERWRLILFNVVSDLNDCTTWSERHEVNYRRRKWHVAGTAKDIENVRTLVNFCLQEIEHHTNLWVVGQHLAPNKLRMGKDDFRLGMAVGITDKMKEERIKVESETKSESKERGLVLVSMKEQKENAIGECLKALGLKLKTKKGNSRRVPEATPYSSGYETGKSLSMQSHRIAPQKLLK